MTWTKLSDDFSDDCWTLSDAAFRLHTEALIWSNRKLLDLVIPKSDLVRFSRRTDAVEELVAVGWWTETARTYVINHHARYQRSREAVINQQKANSQNGSKGGRPPREVFNPDEETESVTDTQSESLSERDRTGQAYRQGSSEQNGGRNVNEHDAAFFSN
jgi:hypothetical protein